MVLSVIDQSVVPIVSFVQPGNGIESFQKVILTKTCVWLEISISWRKVRQKVVDVYCYIFSSGGKWYSKDLTVNTCFVVACILQMSNRSDYMEKTHLSRFLSIDTLWPSTGAWGKTLFGIELMIPGGPGKRIVLAWWLLTHVWSTLEKLRTKQLIG